MPPETLQQGERFRDAITPLGLGPTRQELAEPFRSELTQRLRARRTVRRQQPARIAVHRNCRCDCAPGRRL